MNRISTRELVVESSQADDFADVRGGADVLRLLATVSHNQAESAADDLESIADGSNRLSFFFW